LSKKGTGKYIYRLSNKLNFEKLPKIPGIEFETETDNRKKYVKAFEITIKNTTEKKGEKTAEKIAKNLTNLMSTSCMTYTEGFFTQTIFTESGSIQGNLTSTFQIIGKHLFPINIDKKMFEKIKSNSNFQQDVARMHSALKGFESNNPESVIRELFNVVGHHMPRSLEKFSALRHVLSHNTVSAKNREKVEKSFGKKYFKFTNDGIFDYTSDLNMKNLNHQAYEFYDGVKHHILKI